MNELTEKINKICINEADSLLIALKKMDQVGHKLLAIVGKDRRLINLISVGDIQRAIISGKPLSTRLVDIDIEKKLIMDESSSIDEIREDFLKYRFEFMPVLNNEGCITQLFFWEDLFEQGNKSAMSNKIELPVVIMAGGKGTRLKPISNVLPKPLTPIGEGTIVEEIIKRFSDFGCEDFFLSVNYKKEMIKYYLSENTAIKNLNYFVENKPLGTGGSLSLLKGKFDTSIFVTNCDILIDQDLAELYEYHTKNKNLITMVAALKHFSIPYGTLETKEDGLLEVMTEKPEITYKINAGVYILEPSVLERIPENTFYHITQLIDEIKSEGGRVGVFPISEQSWMDIGEWPEYVKTVKRLSKEPVFKGL